MRCIFTHDPPMTKSLTLGGDTGTSTWTSISFSSKNKTSKTKSWNWSASSGEDPNQYQRDYMVQIHGNHPDQNFVQIMAIHHGLPYPTGASSLSTAPTMAMSQNRAISLLFTLILKILHNGNTFNRNLPVGLISDLTVCGGGPIGQHARLNVMLS